jgi:hypothetical protein
MMMRRRWTVMKWNILTEDAIDSMILEFSGD